MKFVIVGAGTAASISCSILLYKFPHAEVVCYYDSTKPTIQVGESSTPFLAEMLFHTLGISAFDLHKFKGTAKYGLRFDNWSAEPFYHPFANVLGIHFDSSLFSEFVLTELLKRYNNFKMIDQNIEDLDSLDADYIIDCRGFPELNDDYQLTDIETVNSVLLKVHNKYYDEQYTNHYAHENGWMFGIPLTHRKTFGYLYNSNITSSEDAKKDFNNLIDGDITRELSWKSFYKKEALSGRVLANGNRAVFIEPLQAMSLHFYMENINNLGNLILHKTFENENGFNNHYNNRIQEMLDILSFHYYHNSGPYKDSKFWKQTKNACASRSLKVKRWMQNPTAPTYSMFVKRDAEYIYNGMNTNT